MTGLGVEPRLSGSRLCSQLFWGHRSSSLPQTWPLTRHLRAITVGHPWMCLSMYLIILSRKLSNATFRYNYQFTETKDVKKHTEVHMWRPSTNNSHLETFQDLHSVDSLNKFQRSSQREREVGKEGRRKEG